MLPDTIASDRAAAGAAAPLHVLFFGEVADRLGRSASISIPAAGCRLSEVRRILTARLPEAADALTNRGVRAAVAQELAAGDPWVLPGCEVAFFSAFSGG